VKLIGGDTKWNIERIVATANPSGDIKLINFSKKYYPVTKNEIDNEDIGRLNIIDPNAKQQWYRSEIRFSERYNLHTYYNGLSAFRGLDYLETSDLFGSIQRVVNIQSGILVVALYKIQPVYVNRDRLLDFNANQSIGRTSRILNIAEKVINDWGTRNPESVFERGGHVYGFDAYNGIVWRYAQDGQTPISENGRHIFFKRVGRNRMGIARITDKVITTFDKEHSKVYFSFKAEPEGFTVAYEDLSENKGWKGSYSFVPEMFANVNGLFFSFKNGILWQHNSNFVARCNFYGVQYGASVTSVFNPEPSAIKVPKAIRVQSNKLFTIPLINVLASDGYPLGQRSKLFQANKWFLQEGQFFAQVLNDYMDSAKRFRDITDPLVREVTALIEGRALKIDAATVQFQANDPSVQNRLRRADIEYFNSENTF
jgi:hypothetical protein